MWHRALYLAAAAQLFAGTLAAAQAPQSEGGPCPGSAYTAADCPGVSCYAGAPNGCGSRSLVVISDQIVPDKWPGGVDFTAACNAHDVCYFTLGSQKDACDRTFLDALLAECNRAVGCIDIPILGQRCADNPLRDACAQLAQTYYEAVQRLGQPSFDKDQADQAAHVEQCKTGAAQHG
ncbi:hypothetical protein ABPG75_003929 [Micractinium tetrahymenae]